VPWLSRLDSDTGVAIYSEPSVRSTKTAAPLLPLCAGAVVCKTLMGPPHGPDFTRHVTDKVM